MNALATSGEFSVSLRDGTSALNVQLVGDANMDAVDHLGRSLVEIHERAISARATEVVVDLRQLEFMNSACFKKIVTWITRVEEVEASSRYRIRFVSNAKIHWQRRSLHALQMFAIDLVSVDA